MSMLYTNSLMMLERAMNFQWTKQNVINDNIVNAETPNYKAKYVTFEEELRSRIRSAALSPDKKLGSMRSAIGTAAPRVHVAQYEATRLDDNGVNITEQSTEATRNALQMQYTMDSINSNLSLMRTLIRGQ